MGCLKEAREKSSDVEQADHPSKVQQEQSRHPDCYAQQLSFDFTGIRENSTEEDNDGNYAGALINYYHGETRRRNQSAIDLNPGAQDIQYGTG